MSGRPAFSRFLFVAALLLAGAAALFLRWHDLDHPDTRSDELNQFALVLRGPAAEVLRGIWKDPPWPDQVPFMDSIPVIWCGISGQGDAVRAAHAARDGAKMAPVRQPFAFIGSLAWLLAVAWVWRRRGRLAALLCALWLGLGPFFVYHSREAYYYTPLMLFATWMQLRGLDFWARLRAGGRLRAMECAEWFCAAFFSCMSHFAAWPLAAAWWAGLWWAGERAPEAGKERDPGAKTGHRLAMLMLGLGLVAAMSRWIVRAVRLALETAGGKEHIGYPSSWSLERLLPVWCGGIWTGWALLAVLLAAAAWLVLRRVRDAGLLRLWGWWLAGFLATAAVVLPEGRGVTKWVYFSALGPLWTVAGSALLARACNELRRAGWPRTGRLAAAACAALLVALLAVPAWWVVTVEGKPTPYRMIRDALESHLQPGDLAIADSWLESWNGLQTYPSRGPFVGFALADEPYDVYVENGRRKPIATLFAARAALGFLRVTGNNEDRDGKWEGPGKFFDRHLLVVPPVANRLARWGLAPMEEFYFSESRLAVEIHYDTHADAARKAVDDEWKSIGFWGTGFTYHKPWLQDDWQNYRILNGEGEFEIWNLLEEDKYFAVGFRGCGWGNAEGLSTEVEITHGESGESVTLSFEPQQIGKTGGYFRLVPGCNHFRARTTGNTSFVGIALEASCE